MKIEGKVIVVTGGANGIGRALCRRFATGRAEAVVVADIDFDGARGVADEIGAFAVGANVANEQEVSDLVTKTLDRFGRIDLFCSNAGIATDGGPDVPDAA